MYKLKQSFGSRSVYLPISRQPIPKELDLLEEAKRGYIMGAYSVAGVINGATSFETAQKEIRREFFERQTAQNLKALCKTHSLKVSGRKAELVDRLLTADIAIP